MSDEIQPVVPAESDNAVEQAAVAEVSAPDVETTGQEEVLEKIQEKLDSLPEDIFLSPTEVDALIEKIFFEKSKKSQKIQLKADRLPCWFPGGGAWNPGEPRDVSEDYAAALLRLEAFEHVHDESCVHPADEATESHEEGL